MMFGTTSSTRGRTGHDASRWNLRTLVVILVSLAVAQAPLLSSKNTDTDTDGTAAPSIQIRPRMSFAGTTVQAMVHVPSNEDNRLMRVVIDSENYFRSSDVQLNGERAPITHFIVLHYLPAGHHVMSVVVYRSDGEETRTRSAFEVRSGLADDDALSR